MKKKTIVVLRWIKQLWYKKSGIKTVNVLTFWWVHCEIVLLGPAQWTKPDVQVEKPEVVGGLLQSYVAEPKTTADVSLHPHGPIHKWLADITDLQHTPGHDQVHCVLTPQRLREKNKISCFCRPTNSYETYSLTQYISTFYRFIPIQLYLQGWS